MPARSQLDRIEDKLDRLLASDDHLISAQEAREMLGARSKAAFYKVRVRLGLRFVMPGRYRRADIAQAVQRAASLKSSP